MAGAANAAELSLALDVLEAPDFTAKAVSVSVGEKHFRLAIGELSLLGRHWRNLRVSCGTFRLEPDLVECRDGVADTGAKTAVAFSYRPKARALELTLQPAPRETWRLHVLFPAQAPRQERKVEVTVENGVLAHLGPWLPAGWLKTSAGTFSGRIALEGSAQQNVSASVALRGIAFSDASGLHAGERLDAELRLTAQQAGAQWRWQAALDWKGGDVFWQPLYLSGSGQSVSARGTLDAGRLVVSDATARFPDVGELRARADWDRRSGRLASAEASSGPLDAPNFYARVLKPLLFGTPASDLRVAGGLEITSLRLRDGELEAMDIATRELSFEDTGRRFAVFGMSGRIPWHRSDPTELDLQVKGGEVLKMPFGAVKLPLTMRGMTFRLATVEVPVLDGKLTVKGFATDPPGEEGWRWAFSGAMTPVSMERFTEAVGWPVMHGTISAAIPKVSFARSTLRVGGALLFNVFDGTVQAANLTLTEPFGKAPRLSADLEMRNLDLDQLTRTFSFGKITGRIDAAVAGLEMVNWAPVRFDARIHSSAGDYRKKISQMAVQNITALGGAGATAAIQRTFLRFFEEFGYERLGLTCRLEHDVCRMGGIEDTAQGYAIVKGGGIPALTVMGYNRAVNWPDLMERLRHVVQGNVHAVVR